MPILAATTERRKRAAGRRAAEGSLLALFLTDACRAAIVLLLLHVFVFNFSLVRGSSMQPNIHDGDRLLVDKLSYTIGDVSRFDVVILACPKNPDVDYVKRIVGLPGDRIDIANGRLRINGAPLPEPFAHVVDWHTDGEWRVPRESYFVLGDNRPVSSDSREGWCVDRGLIKGRVRACFWPLARFRTF